MIAVLIARPEQESRAIEILRRCGSHHLWRAEGTWRNGSWLDYDPRGPLAAI
jgi:muconolactone delta-isomerase